MMRGLVLCATLVGFSTARGDDIREQVRIDNAFVDLGWTSRSAAFSPDGKILVTASIGGNGGIFGRGPTIFWDPATGKKLATLGASDNVAGLMLPQDGKKPGTHDGDDVGALAFSPDGRTLAGATERDVCLWDVQTRKLTGRLKGSQYAYWMIFSPDGTILATAGRAAGDVQILGVKEEKVVATLKAKGPDVRALAFSGDGKSLAVGYHDGTIRVWDVKAERETVRLSWQHQRNMVLAFEPGDRTLLSVGTGRMIVRWDLTTKKPTENIGLRGTAEPRQLAFGPGLATLALVDKDGGLTVWNTKTGARVSNLKAKLCPGVFAFSRDGKWLAAEPDEGKPVKFSPGGDKPIKPIKSVQVWAVGKPADK